MNTDVEGLINKIEEQVIMWRRHFHANPELSFKEINTSQFVYETLKSFGSLEVTRPTKTSVMAKLKGKRPGKTLALRADMDALPIQELNDFEFVSKFDGVMHACGHDGHTAILLGAAKVLVALKENIAGEIKFLFQHAEELQPGGAQEMVKAGVVYGVDRVVGLHLLSTLDHTLIGISKGAMTANSDVFHVIVIGKGGHASDPKDTIDPIPIGAEIISNLQQIISRKLSATDKVVLSVTKINGGVANNVIPSTVSLTGSVRTIDEEIRKAIPDWIEQIVKGITQAHGATYEFAYTFGYSAVINDERVTSEMVHISRRLFDEEQVVMIPPGTRMSGEDFSAFSSEVPGCFMVVGAGNKAKGIVHPHHHPNFTFDESALKKGVALFVSAGLELNHHGLIR